MERISATATIVAMVHFFIGHSSFSTLESLTILFLHKKIILQKKANTLPPLRRVLGNAGFT
jgi:hypothetical protein